MGPIQKLQRLQAYLNQLAWDVESPYGELLSAISGDLRTIEIDIQRIVAGCDEDMPEAKDEEMPFN